MLMVYIICYIYIYFICKVKYSKVLNIVIYNRVTTNLIDVKIKQRFYAIVNFI